MFNLSYLFLVIPIDLPLCYIKSICDNKSKYTLTIGNPKCPQTRLNQILSMYQAINL